MVYWANLIGELRARLVHERNFVGSEKRKRMRMRKEIKKMCLL